jgi:ribonuclease HI
MDTGHARRYNTAMNEVLTLEFDGGSRGNPGPAGIGVVLRAADGTPIVTLGRYIGRATNNVAEYRALITGIEQALKLGASRLYIRGDSELIIRQVKGQYRVKSPELRPLYEEAMALLRKLAEVKIDHNLRHRNELADRLANLAMDRRAEVTDADPGSVETPAPAASKQGDRHACPRCGCAISILTPSSIRPHQLRDFTCQCGMRMNRA